jgi:hypothetical protein
VKGSVCNFALWPCIVLLSLNAGSDKLHVSYKMARPWLKPSNVHLPLGVLVLVLCIMLLTSLVHRRASAVPNNILVTECVVELGRIFVFHQLPECKGW